MPTPAPVRLLTREMISSLLTLDDCIAAVEEAFVAHARGNALKPELMHVDTAAGEFHIKAGGLRAKRTYFACKINGGFFENRARHGLPNIIGLILLCDGDTGVPLAVMESSLVTRFRTGAASAVAAKYLALPDSSTVTICGAGIQAEIQLLALKRVLPIQKAFVWSRSGAAEFAKRISAQMQIDVRPAEKLAEATLQSQVIVTCTPAKSWFLGREHVAPGTFVAAVGADSPDKQELEPALLASSLVVPDLLRQAATNGDLHHALAAGLMSENEVHAELGAIASGQKLGRQRREQITVFDSTGTALQDAAAAAVAYERAEAAGLGDRCAFWG